MAFAALGDASSDDEESASGRDASSGGGSESGAGDAGTKKALAARREREPVTASMVALGEATEMLDLVVELGGLPPAADLFQLTDVCARCSFLFCVCGGVDCPGLRVFRDGPFCCLLPWRMRCRSLGRAAAP